MRYLFQNLHCYRLLCNYDVTMTILFEYGVFDCFNCWHYITGEFYAVIPQLYRVIVMVVRGRQL